MMVSAAMSLPVAIKNSGKDMGTILRNYILPTGNEISRMANSSREPAPMT